MSLERVLIDPDHLTCHVFGRKPHNLFSPRGPPWLGKQWRECLHKGVHVSRTHVTPVRLPNHSPDITNVGRHNRQVTCHGLFDDSRRAFLKRREQQGVTGVEIQG